MDKQLSNVEIEAIKKTLRIAFSVFLLLVIVVLWGTLSYQPAISCRPSISIFSDHLGCTLSQDQVPRFQYRSR
jgi:hypothetical protein